MNIKVHHLLALLIIPLIMKGCSFSASDEVSVTHAQHGEVYQTFAVEEGDIITLSWIHSVDQTPWLDHFQVTSSCSFLLKETNFASYGAGVAHDYENVVSDGEMFTARGIDECHDTVNWIHSEEADYQIKRNEEVMISPGDLPHHEPLKMINEKR
ncbi:uncharacterized protein DUF1850 [Salsuginibacillus halophilus]|uniref:Uncharacterized protein DUF1850 n=1 Tax=Salsuginibacillus halophilus TaxID=517424 RepID=A0A2P8HI14_9BACI|nr:DUF1850 domain-containing protein [Salsuginibacillus halophilus]PSL45853.1 uncharacterized protein DUF1850 [Salsuginibacillus halophilus]